MAGIATHTNHRMRSLVRGILTHNGNGEGIIELLGKNTDAGRGQQQHNQRVFELQKTYMIVHHIFG